MISDESSSVSKLTPRDIIIAGAGSGFMSRVFTQPLDVIKIRFQLQEEPISKSMHSKYHSIIQSAKLIVEEEGLKALWKGHVPAQFLSVTFGTLQFWSYEKFCDKMSIFIDSPKSDSFVSFAGGVLSGCAATVVSFPFDVIRTRLVAQSEQNKIYNGFLQSFTRIIKEEGVLVLYRGLWPTILQVGPYAGVNFMCYKLFNRLYKYLVNSESTTLSSSLVAGSLSGLFAKTAIYPFDLVKKRLQVQGFERGRETFGKTSKYEGLNHCFAQIYKEEGLKGFFKGLNPSLIKAIITSGLYFSSYEMICKFLNNIK